MKQKGAPRFETAQWFKEFFNRPCFHCGRKATGYLMSYRNEEIAPACARCGSREAKRAREWREAKEEKK